MTVREGATPGTQWNLYTSRSAYCAEIAEILWRRGWTLEALIDNMPGGPEPSELGPVISPSDLDPTARARPTAVPLMTPGHRFVVVDEAISHGVTYFPSLIDPTAVVARTSLIGQGTVVNAMAVVSSGSVIGRFVHVNRSASLGHHAVIDDYVSFGPGCVLAGRINVGRGTFIGAGAVIAPKVTIGENATVGAGALVVRDVPPNTVVIGNPARVLRKNDVGFEGVGVP